MSVRISSVLPWVFAGILTSLFALTGYFLPGMQIIFSLFWAVPIVYLIRRYGLYQGCLAILLAGIIAAIVSDPENGLLAMLEIGSLALVMGLLYKNGVPARQAMWICVFIAVLLQLIILGATYGQYTTQAAEVQQDMEKQLDEIIASYKQAGLIVTSPEGLSEESLRKGIRKSAILAWQLVPGTAVILATLSALFNYRFAYRYMLTRQMSLPEDISFGSWRFPWYVIWGMIIGLGLLLIGEDNGVVKLLGMNIIMVSLFGSLILGLAVLSYYLSRVALPWFLKIIIIFFLIFNGIISIMILTIIGLFDPVVNFRRLEAKTQ
ncbi:MAG: DUF2232 domain-containing protein [Carboxydocellales bacterium]